MVRTLLVAGLMSSFVLSAAVPGCGPVDVPDISADFWDERTTEVNVAATDPLSGSATDSVVDLSKQGEIGAHLAELTKLDVPEIWLEIPSVDATNETTKASGHLEVSHDGSEGSWTTVGSYTDLSIAQGAKIEVVPDAAMVSKFKEWARADGKFHVRYSWSIDKAPGKFSVKSRIHFVASVEL